MHYKPCTATRLIVEQPFGHEHLSKRKMYADHIRNSTYMHCVPCLQYCWNWNGETYFK